MPAPAKEKLKTHLVVSGGLTSGDMTDSSGKSIVSGSGGGIDAHVLIPLFGGFSLVGSVDSVSFADAATTDNVVDASAGLGYAIRLGAFVPFVDLKGGATVVKF